MTDEIAFSFERSDIPTSFTDLDKQAAAIRKDGTDQMNDAEAVVADTPANPPKSASDWIASADAIVVPTISSGRNTTILYAAVDQIDSATRMQKPSWSTAITGTKPQRNSRHTQGS